MLNGEYSDLRAAQNTRITLTFSVSLANGELIDEVSEPATFVFGDGSFLPAFENAIKGMKAGAQRSVDLAAGEGFGEHNAKNLQILPKKSFNTQLDLQPGLVVSFSSPEGDLPGVVKEVNENTVKIDFNHPLAGKALSFSYHILRVEEVAEQAVELK